MVLGTVYVIFKKLISLISAIMLLIIAGQEKNIPSPEGAEIISKNTYVLFDYSVSSQGVTNDGEYFYFSGNEHIGKADIETGEVFRVNVDAIPEELQEKGCNHIGGESAPNLAVLGVVNGEPIVANIPANETWWK